MPIKEIGQPSIERRIRIKTGTTPEELLNIAGTGIGLSRDIYELISEIEEQKKKKQAEAIVNLRNLLVSGYNLESDVWATEEGRKMLSEALRLPKKFIEQEYTRSKERMPENISLKLKSVLGLVEVPGAPVPILTTEAVKPEVAMELAGFREMEFPTPTGAVIRKPAGIPLKEVAYLWQTMTPYYRTKMLTREDIEKAPIAKEFKEVLYPYADLGVPIDTNALTKLLTTLSTISAKYKDLIAKMTKDDLTLLTRILTDIEQTPHYAHWDADSKLFEAYRIFYRMTGRYPAGLTGEELKERIEKKEKKEIDLKETLGKPKPKEEIKAYEVKPSTATELDVEKLYKEYIEEIFKQ